MTKPALDPKTPPTPDELEPATGTINLTLVYTLLALALLGAILFAVFIVWPFYIRR